MTTHVLANITKKGKEICLDNFIDCTHYSSIDTLLRLTSYVLLFVAMLKKCRRAEPGNGQLIAADDIQGAEITWVTSVQLGHFEREI